MFPTTIERPTVPEMGNAATTALTYGIVITLISGVIGYGLGLLFRLTAFKGRRRTVGVGLSLAAIAVVLLLGGAAVQEVFFESRPSAAAAFLVLIFVGTVWYGLGSASNEVTDQPAREKVFFGSPNSGADAEKPEADSKSRHIGHPVVSTDSDVAPAELDEDELYARAWTEFETGRRDQGLWSRCFADSNGDENRAKAAYLTERVKALRAGERRQQEIAAERKRRLKLENAKDEYQAIVKETLGMEPDSRRLPDVDVYGQWGETKLMEAARIGDFREVIRLLAAGADPTLRERYTADTARTIAERNGHAKIAHKLELAEYVHKET